jgi:hypothetical protein
VSNTVRNFTVALVLLASGIGIGLLLGHGGNRRAATRSPGDIVGASYRMEPAYLVAAHVPNAEVDNVLKAVVAAVGLKYGKYDRVAFLDAPGLEQFRPMEGSKAGRQAEAVRVPTTIVSFSVPHDPATLRKALDAIRYVHSYEEPVIYVSEVWRSRATARDDSNPNRWWNRKPQ